MLLRGGTYSNGNYNATVATNASWYIALNGLTNNPITVKGYPGERAIFNGGLYCWSNYVTFWGFEITCLNTTRWFTNSYAERHGGLNLYGYSPRAINMIIHDTGQPGIYVPTTAIGPVEISGCIIYHCGDYDDVDGPPVRGSAIYLQHGQWPVIVTENVTWGNLTTGGKLYGSDPLSADNGYFEGNISFNHPSMGLWVGGGSPGVTNLHVYTNYFYANNGWRFGFDDNTVSNKDATIIGNYVAGGADQFSILGDAWYWKTLTFRTNTLVSINVTNNTAQGTFFSIFPTLQNDPVNVDRNTYLGGQSKPFYWNSFANVSFLSWQGDGNDANGTYTTTVPTSNLVVVRTNRYEPGRSHVAIYNWHNDSTATVDLSNSGLASGQQYTVQDVQNLGTTVTNGTFTASTTSVVLPLNLTAFSQVIGTLTNFTGWWLDPYSHTPTTFNTFLILPGSIPTASSNIAKITNFHVKKTKVGP